MSGIWSPQGPAQTNVTFTFEPAAQLPSVGENPCLNGRHGASWGPATVFLSQPPCRGKPVFPGAFRTRNPGPAHVFPKAVGEQAGARSRVPGSQPATRSHATRGTWSIPASRAATVWTGEKLETPFGSVVASTFFCCFR